MIAMALSIMTNISNIFEKNIIDLLPKRSNSPKILGAFFVQNRRTGS